MGISESFDASAVTVGGPQECVEGAEGKKETAAPVEDDPTPSVHRTWAEVASTGQHDTASR